LKGSTPKRIASLKGLVRLAAIATHLAQRIDGTRHVSDESHGLVVRNARLLVRIAQPATIGPNKEELAFDDELHDVRQLWLRPRLGPGWVLEEHMATAGQGCLDRLVNSLEKRPCPLAILEYGLRRCTAAGKVEPGP
jgi:hypothetical protein